MSVLTREKMLEIIESKSIDEQTDEVKKQVNEFAFGAEFMESEDKGSKKNYNERKGK